MEGPSQPTPRGAEAALTMGIFRSFVEKIRARNRATTPTDNWREAFAVAFSGLVLDKPSIATLVESLPAETRDELLGSQLDELEARVFDLWLVSHALRRSVKHIPPPDLSSVLDAGHLEVYKNLLSDGMSEDQIMRLQHRLAERYAEYDKAYAGFWAGQDGWVFTFGRLVTLRVFGFETTDGRVATTLALGVVNPAVLSIAKTFGAFKPPLR